MSSTTIKLKKGDRVRVLTGKDRGKEGVIMRVIPKANKVIVDGVNIAKKHQKARTATSQGGIIDKDMPIPVPNVALLSPSDGKPTKVGYKVLDDGTKIRVCRRTGAEI
jgi:large subunit ribosomal protein L24